MKKFFCLALCALTVLTVLPMAGCGEKKSETLSLGLGVYTSAEAVNAEKGEKGGGTVISTVAAVLIDGSGRIADCFLDAAENELSHTSDGKALSDGKFLTKRELGEDYGMKTYGGAKLEWYEQADAFERVCIGKTPEEVKALVASDGKGSEEVVRAGCTIAVSDFVRAIEKAFANARPSAAVKGDTLKLGVSTVRSTEDASAEAHGKNRIDTTFFAATVDPSDRITAAYSDCAEIEFSFDAAGTSDNGGKWVISTKRDAGDAYGMKTYGGADKEWYEQADVFDRACIGKTSKSLSLLLGKDGYGNAELQTAGCTIVISEFVKAAAKIG